MLDKLLGINWKTTLAGIGAIVLAIGRIGIAYRTKDIEAIVTDGQLIIETLSLIVVGLGLAKAKDQNVTGTGVTAKAVDDQGIVTNREGTVVGQQPPLK